jgi:hypothetical protein
MNFATILNPDRSQADGTGLRGADVRLHVGPFLSDALVLVTAFGASHYEGDVLNAGMILTIKVDDATVMQDDSFEAESSNIDFRTSASYNFILKQGRETDVEARTDPLGEGGEINNTRNRVTLQCFALATKP